MADELTTTAQGFDPQDIAQNKVMAILNYCLIIWFWIASGVSGSKFAKYHANQAIVLWISVIASLIILTILSAIIVPFLFFFSIIVLILMFVIYIAAFVFTIIGIINASKGEAKPLPVIGTMFTIMK